MFVFLSNEADNCALGEGNCLSIFFLFYWTQSPKVCSIALFILEFHFLPFFISYEILYEIQRFFSSSDFVAPQRQIFWKMFLSINKLLEKL